MGRTRMCGRRVRGDAGITSPRPMAGRGLQVFVADNDRDSLDIHGPVLREDVEAGVAGVSEVGLMRATSGGTMYYLIEYRENGRTVGYLQDLRRGNGAIDVVMTRAPEKALRFDTREYAMEIVFDWAFQRTVAYADRFFVEGHMDCTGPTLEADESGSVVSPDSNARRDTSEGRIELPPGGGSKEPGFH